MDTTRIITVLRTHQPNLIGAWVFGSRAKGEHRPDSDLDIAIACTQPTSPLERHRLKQALTTSLGYVIDLVDLKTAPPTLALEVLEAEQLIFSADESEIAKLETYLLSHHANFQVERAGIVKDILVRGHIYGSDS